MGNDPIKPEEVKKRWNPWLKGAAIGLFSYLFPLSLWLLILHVPQVSDVFDNLFPDGTARLLVASLLIALAMGPGYIVFTLALYLPVLRHASWYTGPPILFYIIAALTWTLLGAVFSKLLGTRKGCIVLFILEGIFALVNGFTIALLIDTG